MTHGLRITHAKSLLAEYVWQPGIPVVKWGDSCEMGGVNPRTRIMNYKQQAIERFSNDLYATKTTGVVIEDAEVNYAKCRLEISEAHLNAAGFVMGGAIFTLADFTFAVASNMDNPLTVSLSSSINYLNGTKGPVLYAEAKCLKNGRNVCFFEVTVVDSTGKTVAAVTVNGFRK
jgi:acyl-CoA thioesterase